ncbi:MAG: hypothetical protein QME90_09305 [Thermodesulfobacteriota bacterium]|nr:hypothetical protein [Thermodesulfobacteriota bacterium]
MKKTACLLILMAMVSLFGPAIAWSENKPKGNPPLITTSFAVERGNYGYIWRIYLEAEDPDGDMSKIAVVVDQPGYGRYFTDWTILRSPYRGKVRGYLQWNTFSRRTGYLSEWTNINVTVSIFDKAGNESNEVVFPFTFETGVKNPYQYKLPAPFDQEGLPKLGYITVDLFEPTLIGGDGLKVP